MSAWADRGPLSGVVGRAVEHEQVSGLLAGSPLITLTGAAGVGKSVLARAVLDEHTARHGGTVIRVGCWDGLTEGGLMAGGLTGALVRAAGLDSVLRDTERAAARRSPQLPPYDAARSETPAPAGDAETPAGGGTRSTDTAVAALAAHCVRSRATLLLDDCDPLLDECARLVRRLLRAEPALRIVATARRPLGPAAECVVDIGPLPVTLGEGIAGPAVELLAARTGPAAPELLVAVCEALEGSPLAIELAAQQLDRMPLSQLAARAGADGPLFWSGPAPTARHTSLYAAHAAGYALCSPVDRRVWARLSVLPGDFDPWLAGCVCASSDVPAAEVDAALERLRLASVLERVREAGSAPADTGAALPPRYRLPRGARDFGRTRLREAGEESSALRRFRQACAALAAEAQIAWQGTDQQIAVRLVEDEQHNLDAALTRPPQDPDDALIALEIAVSLWFRWAACGFRHEGRAHLDRLLLLSRDDTALRARALWLAGWLAAQEHAPGAAEALLERAWAAAVMHADSDGLARIAHAHGVLALYREDAGAAVACLEEAARHTSKDPWFGPGPAHSGALLAIALAAVDGDRAEAAARRAWECRHSDGDFWLHSTVLYARALAERAQGRPEAALRTCRKALAAKRLIGDPLFIAGARNMLAALRREVREGTPAPETREEGRWWQRGGSGVRSAPFFSRLRAGS
ncbi:LuxR family transcriptional regulator [Streptomyces piniterrae]|uniref:LuxR family transcriptional regulator n=1 Tax=Streptomyces piniterrae TaxID=2571125 RepID=A0A4U0P909_9ACTN|nr:AAA family ATPase [Streptomyces piniterrae]TJZ59204.1 LuxR family transcriptional regulator [Streptomyces piniterrae]